MSEEVILFIVEGESRDSRFADEMARCFLRGRHEVEIINVPAAQNIYMLYNTEVFALRICCLFDFETINFDTFRKLITPKSIFDAECDLVNSKASVFVLSAFPEFLLDYFKRDFWNNRVRLTKFKFDKCPKVG